MAGCQNRVWWCAGEKTVGARLYPHFTTLVKFTSLQCKALGTLHYNMSHFTTLVKLCLGNLALQYVNSEHTNVLVTHIYSEGVMCSVQC